MEWGSHVNVYSIFSDLRYVTANSQWRLSLFCWDQYLFFGWDEWLFKNTACSAFCIYFPVSWKPWQNVLDINYFFCLFVFSEFENLTKYVSSLKRAFRNKAKILHIKLRETFFYNHFS